MRKPQNSRRGRGRNTGGRSMGNGRQQRRPQNPSSRVYDSQGPDGRVKGTPAQLFDRYRNAAREVQGSDRILAESLLQFADHYYRLSLEGQDQQKAERSRHDGERAQENCTSHGKTERESAELAEQQATSAAAERQTGGDEERTETEARVTEDQIPFLRQRGRAVSERPDGLTDAPGSAQDGTMGGTGVMPNGEDKPAPRRRGRPRKAESGEQPAALDGADDIEKKPARRGPGRPRKSETISAGNESLDEVTAESGKPVRRGPGRPRKSDTVAADGAAEDGEKRPVRRGPGRPRKTRPAVPPADSDLLS